MKTTLKETLSKATPVQTSVSSHRGKNALSISIVNCDNGRRVSISARLYEALGQPESLQFMISEKKSRLLIGCNLSEDGTSYPIKRPEKPVIYNSKLVNLLTEAFELDYEGKTSLSFGSIKIREENDLIVAVITIREKK